MRHLAVYVVFFFSGISGLLYQVIWVRLFGNVFGNTVYSASLVTAVFMLGLGFGSYCIGRWSDRRFQRDNLFPLRMYGWSELLIAGLCIVVALALPRLSEFSAAYSVYTVSEHGWHHLSFSSHALRYVAAVGLLAPITFLMGGTLTLLIRFLVSHDVGTAGWKVGVLYGINTLGAAIGAFASDMALIPRIGIFNTEMLAVGLNLIAGLIALTMVARLRWQPVTALAAATKIPVASGVEGRTALRLTAVGLGLSGFAALGIEIVWFRYFASLLGGYRSVFSSLLGVMLLSMFLGSVLGAYVNHRFTRPGIWLMAAQTGFVLSTLLLLATYDSNAITAYLDSMVRTYAESTKTTRSLLEHWSNLRVVILIIGIPALLLGLLYPLANAHVQNLETEVGERAGLLYLANTIGNLLGALVAGFLLLPLIGVQLSVTVLMLCATVSLFPFYWSFSNDRPIASKHQRHAMFGCIAAAATGLILFGLLPAGHLLRMSFQLDTEAGEIVLALHEGLNESLMVTERAGVERTLHTNGHSMSSTAASSQRYMRAFSHVPLMSMEAPERVLVICFGVGNTLHAASLYDTVTELHVADLSKDILEHAGYFAAFNQNVLADPRVSVFMNDGRHHLLMQSPEFYDLITLEPPPIAHAGVSALYSREFYNLAKNRLKGGGYVSQWLPAYQLPEEAVLAMVAAFVDVFPNATLLHAAPREFILLGQKNGTNRFPLQLVRQNLARFPRVRADLERILLNTVTELVGSFASSSERLAQVTDGVKSLTDDWPIAEYAVLSRLVDNRLSATLFDVDSATRWCPECFRNSNEQEDLRNLPAYLEIMRKLYRSEEFLRYHNTSTGGASMRFEPPTLNELEQGALMKSPYLQILFSK